jgi:HAD superfamily hydrolase (TIGR01459 family)
MHTSEIPNDVTGISSLIDRYDSFVFDQWGVLHDGNSLYPGVLAVLHQLQERNKEVLILTNSSKTAGRNIDRLARRFGLPASLYKALISSADIVRDWSDGAYPIDGARHRSVLVLADEGDEQLLAGVKADIVEDIDAAESVVLLSLPVTDDIGDHEDWMSTAVRRGIPIVAPSCDLHTVRPDGVHLGMAGIMDEFQRLGGTVHNVGKPTGHIYARCRRQLTTKEPARVLMVGDQIASDIVGAHAQGWHGLLVRTGAGEEALRAAGQGPHYTLDTLRW